MATASVAEPLQQVLDRFSGLATKPPEESRPTFEEQEAEHREREKRARAASSWQQVKAEIGRRYAACTFDGFEVGNDENTPARRSSLDLARGFAANVTRHIEAGEGLVLVGPRGCGKDHLMVCCLREAAKAGHTVAWVDGQHLFQKFRDLIGKESSEAEAIAAYARPGVLAISDPLPMTGSVTEYQAGVLWRIVERRYRDMRPVWLTANVSNRAEAETRLGPQLADRLFDHARVIRCQWETHRKVLPG